MDETLDYVKAIIIDKLPNTLTQDGNGVLRVCINNIWFLIQPVSYVPKSLTICLAKYGKLLTYEILYNELSDLEFLIPNYIKALGTMINSNYNQFKYFDSMIRASSEIARVSNSFLEEEIERYPSENGDIISLTLTYADVEVIFAIEATSSHLNISSSKLARNIFISYSDDVDFEIHKVVNEIIDKL